MNNHRTTCDPERIDLFLDQKLSDEEQSAFESHLTECGDCRQRLETAAASEGVSFEICESLRDDQLPLGDLTSDDHDSTGEETFSSQATVLKLLAPTDDDRMLGRWGTYEVVGVVGTGGMGVVLKALDAGLNRYVAIKILAPHLGSSGAARKRFSREAQASAAVVHDNVIEIYGVAEAAGLPYLVMPYVRGPSLQRRLDDEGPLAVVEILRVGIQAAAGLAAAHAQGLVHRDVKPANILLADGVERVKLTDFGLARAADDASLTKTGIIAGTPQYMSPEQARGEAVDQRSDLFSLGSVLCAMCTGHPPFRAETSYGVLRRITDEEPRPIREINPDIPDWLCGIVAKLMSKRPDDRFQLAGEVAALLEQCLAHVQQPTAVPLPDVLISLRRDECITRDEYDPGQPTSSPLPPGEWQEVRAAARSFKSRKPLFIGTLAMLALIGISLFTVSVATSDPPNLSRNWHGEDWGQVALTQIAAGEYTGTYTDTVVNEKGPGTIDLKWSRIEHRYNGTWREGEDDRFGGLSVHLVGNEIRGALTTSAKSKVNPATPRLAELTWTRDEALADAEQADLLWVTAIPALEPDTWRWKVHQPKGKRYNMCAAYGKLPAKGFPARPWSISSNEQALETARDLIITAGLRRQNDGNWSLTFSWSINPKQGDFGDSSLAIPKEALRPFQESPSIFLKYTGRGGTEKFNPDAPVTLLRRTAGTPDGTAHDTNSGILIWLRPESSEGIAQSRAEKVPGTVSDSVASSFVAPARSAAVQPAAFSPTFGPVFERVINASGEGKGGEGIDLREDKLVDVPKDFSQWPPMEQSNWIEFNNVDLVVDYSSRYDLPRDNTHKSLMFINPGWSVRHIAGSRWPTATCEELREELSWEQPIGNVIPDLRGQVGGKPVTWAFITRKGDIGMLQVVRCSEHPPAVAIRYKVARQPSSPHLGNGPYYLYTTLAVSGPKASHAVAKSVMRRIPTHRGCGPSGSLGGTIVVTAELR